MNIKSINYAVETFDNKEFLDQMGTKMQNDISYQNTDLDVKINDITLDRKDVEDKISWFPKTDDSIEPNIPLIRLDYDLTLKLSLDNEKLGGHAHRLWNEWAKDSLGADMDMTCENIVETPDTFNLDMITTRRIDVDNNMINYLQLKNIDHEECINDIRDSIGQDSQYKIENEAREIQEDVLDYVSERYTHELSVLQTNICDGKTVADFGAKHDDVVFNPYYDESSVMLNKEQLIEVIKAKGSETSVKLASLLKDNGEYCLNMDDNNDITLVNGMFSTPNNNDFRYELESTLAQELYNQNAKDYNDKGIYITEVSPKVNMSYSSIDNYYKKLKWSRAILANDILVSTYGGEAKDSLINIKNVYDYDNSLSGPLERTLGLEKDRSYIVDYVIDDSQYKPDEAFDAKDNEFVDVVTLSDSYYQHDMDVTKNDAVSSLIENKLLKVCSDERDRLMSDSLSTEITKEEFDAIIDIIIEVSETDMQIDESFNHFETALRQASGLNPNFAPEALKLNDKLLDKLSESEFTNNHSDLHMRVIPRREIVTNALMNGSTHEDLNNVSIDKSKLFNELVDYALEHEDGQLLTQIADVAWVDADYVENIDPECFTTYDHDMLMSYSQGLVYGSSNNKATLHELIHRKSNGKSSGFYEFDDSIQTDFKKMIVRDIVEQNASSDVRDIKLDGIKPLHIAYNYDERKTPLYAMNVTNDIKDKEMIDYSITQYKSEHAINKEYVPSLRDAIYIDAEGNNAVSKDAVSSCIDIKIDADKDITLDSLTSEYQKEATSLFLEGKISANDERDLVEYTKSNALSREEFKVENPFDFDMEAVNEYKRTIKSKPTAEIDDDYEL